MPINFRSLRADEVEVRVNQIGQYSTQLLLYKDARCDMNILDATVGAENWQRSHLRDNANCIVSIWDDEKKQWVSKEDTGTESNTEKEKGLASDSFKRACVNWGIGRELYTAGRINVKNDLLELGEKNGRKFVKDSFYVASMEVERGVITALCIKTEKGKTVFEKKAAKTEQTVICEACHKPIPAETLINGKKYSQEDIAGIGMRRYGKTLCYSCKHSMDRVAECKNANIEDPHAMQEIA